MQTVKKNNRIYKRHLKKSVLIFLITVCVGITAFIGFKLVPKKHKILDDVSIESRIQEEPYQLAVHYPKINHETIDSVIKLYIDDSIKQFEDSGDISDQDEFNIQVESCSNNERYLSYVFNRYTLKSGQAHGETIIEAFAFDTKTDSLIALPELFKTDENFQSFKNQVADTYLKSAEVETGYDSDSVIQTIQESVNEEQEFSFDDKKVHIYFDPYEIAPGYAGAQTVSVPISEIEGIKIKKQKNEELPDMGKPAMGVYNEIKEKEEKELQEAKRQEALEALKGKKLVALTFDDGPHPELTPQLLDMLKSKDAKATFFVLGSRAEYYPEIVKRAHDEGHQIASHTYNHRNLVNLTPDEMKYEIKNTETLIESIIGEKPTLMRPPYGSYDEKVRETSDAAVTLWSVDPEDWNAPDAKSVSDHIIGNTKDGSIVLLHDIHKNSVESVEAIIDKLQKEGYVFITVQELIELRGEFDPKETYASFIR